MVPIHRHPTKDESFVILRGKVRVTTHGDDGTVIGDVVLSQESGGYGVDIPKFTKLWMPLSFIAKVSILLCQNLSIYLC